MKSKIYSYSKTYDYYAVYPMKNASSSTFWILRYFDFINYERNERIIGGDLPQDNFIQSHKCYIPEEIIEPKIIMPVRNPYNRLLSFFLFTQSYEDRTKTEKFTEYLEKIKSDKSKYEHLYWGYNLNPTHIVRVENMYEDLCNIPFINQSDLNQFGILKKMCDKKVNSSTFYGDKENYLNHFNKSLIYELFEPHFNKFGYEK